MSTQYCGCDPTHQPEPWYCEQHRGQGEGGFCPCTEGKACPEKITFKFATPPPAPVFAPIPGVLVIGLGHKARHGKDSVAQFMLESAPADVVRIGFADALYDHCRIVYGMTKKDAPLLQKVGVAMRETNPYAWINAVYWKIIDKKPKVVVIPDTRFENEAAFVKALGGTTLRVIRAGDSPQGTFQASDRDPKHVSECQLDNYEWDLTLFNSGTLEQLRSKATYALAYIQRSREAFRG